MRDGHVGYDGVFGMPPVTVTVMRNVCKIVSSALRVTVVTVILGYPATVTLRENTPQTQNAGVGFTRPSRRVKPPLRSEKSFRFFRLRLQGVTHYTLPCKVVCQTFPLDSLMAGLTPCLSYAPRFG